MKGKQVYCLLLAGMILFSGCTGGENHADTVPTESAETADFPSGIPGRCTALGESLLEKIKTGEVSLACDTVCGYTDSRYAQYFSAMYHLRENEVTDGCILYAANGATADEVSILTPVNAGMGALVNGALQERITMRANDFTGYDDEQAAKCRNAQIVPIGSSVALIIADNPDEIAKALRLSLKAMMTESEGNEK